jgi:hypothetical protein
MHGLQCEPKLFWLDSSVITLSYLRICVYSYKGDPSETFVSIYLQLKLASLAIVILCFGPPPLIPDMVATSKIEKTRKTYIYI